MPLDAIDGRPDASPSSLEQQAYDAIRRALVGGSFVPGDRLPIRQVAAALGTSPMPARAALQRLVAEQVLNVLPSGTATVPLLTRTAFIEMRAIRLQLEPLAALMAAEHMNASILAGLDTRISALDRALEQGNMEVVLTENQHFMFDIYRASRSPLLLGFIETLWLRRGPMYWGARAALLRWNMPFTRHRATVAALRCGDGMRAGTAIRDEIESTTAFLLEEIRFADDPLPSGVAGLAMLKRPGAKSRSEFASRHGHSSGNDA